MKEIVEKKVEGLLKEKIEKKSRTASETKEKFKEKEEGSEEQIERQMHKAICAECGKNAWFHLDLKKKPILCRECFIKNE